MEISTILLKENTELFVKTLDTNNSILRGKAVSPEAVKKPRGRPKKIKEEITKNLDTVESSKVISNAIIKNISSGTTESEVIKKPRGRPKKVNNIKDITSIEKIVPVAFSEVIKKPRGRPKKIKEGIIKNLDIVEDSKIIPHNLNTDTPNISSGVTSPEVLKKPRGRPKKIKEEITAEEVKEIAPEFIKKPRGRSKKIKEEVKEISSESIKKSRGRPKKIKEDLNPIVITATKETSSEGIILEVKDILTEAEISKELLELIGKPIIKSKKRKKKTSKRISKELLELENNLGKPVINTQNNSELKALVEADLGTNETHVENNDDMVVNLCN